MTDQEDLELTSNRFMEAITTSMQKTLKTTTRLAEQILYSQSKREEDFEKGKSGGDAVENQTWGVTNHKQEDITSPKKCRDQTPHSAFSALETYTGQMNPHNTEL